MRLTLEKLAGALLALLLISAPASAQTRVTIAVGGGACLCYLPTVLANQLGEYDKAGLKVDLVDLKGGSDALKAVLGGSADVVSGFFDHCVCKACPLAWMSGRLDSMATPNTSARSNGSGSNDK